ncbi:MAG: PaaI family thioesterase, partial [Candidatus Heimdallarchaeota archaeon]
KFKFLKSPKFTFSIHKVAEQFSGLDGFVHGGIIATLLDEVAGWTIVTNLRTAGLTMESNIKYNKPVPVETELIILGQLIDKTEDKKASAKIKSGIYLMDGTKLAEMTSYWYLPSINQLVKISGKSMEELLKFREDLEQTISKFIT